MNQKEILRRQIARIAEIQQELRRVTTKRRKLEMTYPDGQQDASLLEQISEFKKLGWDWENADQKASRRISAAIMDLWCLGMQVPDCWSGATLHFAHRWKMGIRRKGGMVTIRFWRESIDKETLETARCSLENTRLRLLAAQSILSPSHDITTNQMKILNFLYGRDQPATQHDIAGFISLAPNTVRGPLEGLISAGLCIKPSKRGGYRLSEQGKRYMMLSHTRS